MNKEELSLFLRFKNGDESALREVCHRYEMLLNLRAYKIFLNDERATLAVQEVINILWNERKKLHDPAPEDTLISYLSKKVTDYCKSQPDTLYFTGGLSVFMFSLDGTATLGYNEYLQGLYTLAEAYLPERLVNMFRLFFMERKTISEIAIELGLKPWGVKHILRRTIDRIRLLL